MKKSKACPKCGCGDILCIPGQVGAYGSGNSIIVGATIFSAVKVHRYLCRKCGYSEEWVSEEDIPKLSKKFGC